VLAASAFAAGESPLASAICSSGRACAAVSGLIFSGGEAETLSSSL
jgi:hypothetical protein